jgi:hypothetical protein
MACNVEVNGTTIHCACDGCGAAYNHSTKTYHISCCGGFFQMSRKASTEDPPTPPTPNHVTVDFARMTLLQVAQLLDEAAPGKISVTGPFKKLGKRISLKGNRPLDAFTKELGLHSTSK